MTLIYNIIETVLPFTFAQFDFMKNALLAVILLTPLFGMLGTMAVNNKMAFFSDALGHSALTGIAIGVVLGIGNPIICMLFFGILFGLGIRKVKSSTKASSDTVISVFSSASIALGIVILSKSGGFAKYSAYLIGDILTVSPSYIKVLAVVLVVVYVIWYFIYNKLLLLSVNPSLSSSRGVKNALVENIFVGSENPNSGLPFRLSHSTRPSIQISESPSIFLYTVSLFPASVSTVLVPTPAGELSPTALQLSP